MTTTYLLVDLENVSPASLAHLADTRYQLLVFVGAQQARLPIDFVMSMQRLGTRGRYVQISGRGPNALDFHIAYYIGRLAAVDPTAHFGIIARDAGYNPLVEHLQSQQIRATRFDSLADVPQPVVTETIPRQPTTTIPSAKPPTEKLPKAAAEKTATAKAAAPKARVPNATVPKNNPQPPKSSRSAAKTLAECSRIFQAKLRQPQASRPAREQSLHRAIANHFRSKVTETDIAKIVQLLRSSGFLSIHSGRVAYTDTSSR